MLLQKFLQICMCSYNPDSYSLYLDVPKRMLTITENNVTTRINLTVIELWSHKKDKCAVTFQVLSLILCFGSSHKNASSFFQFSRTSSISIYLACNVFDIWDL
jgi:hypothetical protein